MLPRGTFYPAPSSVDWLDGGAACRAARLGAHTDLTLYHDDSRSTS